MALVARVIKHDEQGGRLPRTTGTVYYEGRDECKLGALPALLGRDGTRIPVRAADRAGRGSAKTREVKLVSVWTAEQRDAEGLPVRDAASVSYSAAIESTPGRDTDPTPAPCTPLDFVELGRDAAST